MELIAGDVEAFHLGFADLDALLVAACVAYALGFQTGLCGGRADQLDHGEAIGERPAAPVLCDVAEQPVLDLVLLRCAWRIVVDVDHEAGLVGQLLQFELPEPHTRTIRAAAVGRDRQLPRLRIALSSHAVEPAADRLHGELGGVAGDPDADEAGIGGHIIHAIETVARPPRPAVRTSAAANKRRHRSSSLEPTVSHRRRIAASSITRPTYARSTKTGIHKT